MNHLIRSLPSESHAFTSNQNKQASLLSRYGLIRWNSLTGAERFVCVAIVLIPVWWIFSWSYAPLFITIGIFAHRLICYKSLGLKLPNLPIIALLLFTVYQVAVYQFNVPDGGPAGLISPIQLWGTTGLLLWYIQSHQVRVRLPVIAWGFSVVVLQAIAYWLFAHFVLSEAQYTPMPNLMARVLNRDMSFASWKAGAVGNFLLPYIPGFKGIGGLTRYSFFFPHPTVSSFVFGFVVLIALDLRKQLLSYWLIGASSFLIIVAQSRNVWLTLVIVISVRWLLTTGKSRGLAFILAFLAITSFTTLSIPAVTNLITDKVTTTAEATANLRRASTEDRNKIYVRTWETIIQEPPIIGHAVPGPEVTPGYEFARIGTESFILGALLYRSGFLGTGIFLTFLVSFFGWLYRTRVDRPLCCFLILLLLTLSSTVTDFMPTETLIIALCAVASSEIGAVNSQEERVSHA